MHKIDVYDPPMCCSSGVCGPRPDERLARFSADLDWLGRQGATVRRFNPAHDPLAFTKNPRVLELLQQPAEDVLPVIVVDDAVVSQGQYPTREQLAQWTGVSTHSVTKSSQATAQLPTAGGCCGGGEC